MEKVKERIRILKLAIDDSWERVTGSTNKQYLEDQAAKRKAWQGEIDQLISLNGLDPATSRPSGKFEMLPEARICNVIFMAEKRNDGSILIDIKKNRFGRSRIKEFDRTDEALEFIRELLVQ